jgi:hypothetical protein
MTTKPRLVVVDSEPAAVGDFGCGDVDLEKFRQENRVPLFPDTLNRWILARTETDNPSKPDVKESLQQVMRLFFDNAPYPGTNIPIPNVWGARHGEPVGAVDELRIVDISRNLDDVIEKVSAMKWRQVKRVYQLPYSPSLKAASPPSTSTGPWFVALEFVYRGSKTSMPWPVQRYQLINPACPLDADWILESAYAPSLEAVPEPPQFWNELANTAKDKLPDLPKPPSALPLKIAVGALTAFGAYTLYKSLTR